MWIPSWCIKSPGQCSKPPTPVCSKFELDLHVDVVLPSRSLSVLHVSASIGSVVLPGTLTLEIFWGEQSGINTGKSERYSCPCTNWKYNQPEHYGMTGERQWMTAFCVSAWSHSACVNPSCVQMFTDPTTEEMGCGQCDAHKGAVPASRLRHITSRHQRQIVWLAGTAKTTEGRVVQAALLSTARLKKKGKRCTTQLSLLVILFPDF